MKIITMSFKKGIICGIIGGLSLFLYSCSNEVSPGNEIGDESPQYKLRVLALGDSLTAGYQLPLSSSYPSQLSDMATEAGYSLEVVNAGVSGDTSSDLLSRLDLYFDEPSDFALLVIGANDGLRGASLSGFRENLEDIVQALQSNNIQVILGGVPLPANLSLQYRKNFSRVYQETAEKYDLFFIENFLEGVAGKAQYNLSDRIHPNKEGYRIISENLFEFLVDNKILDDL